ncbi:alpha/beta hydrolase [Pseudomonas sp. HMWF032]|uniref:alpha/beta fold hydrolase n=1 Tax=unclassified Pseudomonas TaxID=196821 RepID=UPI000D3DAA7A|nr:MULTISPECIES: alpha/beta hydrolase [unclassified Pseudomonas]PTS83937.1 alpha/beta hydrolase [Pseudomonas sp. HMWF032]PTT85293.1 alpha/beta hydrolase [Pseudomonas sp. HMWF010]WAC44028.1 alpha/beta hydrolase [Pseudomonas sp. SL4(2022)]
MHQLEQHILQVNGIDLSLYSAGPATGRPVWLLHGFPECWHSWRQQIEPLTAAGYRVQIPEMRGYGQSSAPRDPAAYDLLTICADIQAAMDQLGQLQVCVVGHDWGAPVAWHLALLEPERVQAVVGMAVPFGGRPRQPAIEIMRQLYAERFHYILHFQQPGVAEAEMDADIPSTLRMMMHNTSAAVPKDHFLQEKPAGAGLFEGMLDPGALPVWCDNAAFDHYRKTFEGRGFYGALNWYRNFERNWLRTEALADRQIEQPALFLLGDQDPVGTLEAYTLKQMPKRVPQLEQHVLSECGHWIQNEKAEQVNRLLLDFLQRQYVPATA